MFLHRVLALTGVAQRLNTALADPTVGGIQDLPLRQITFQALPANGNPIYIGGEATSSPVVTAASYAIYIPAPTQGVPAPPIIIGAYDAGPLRLSDFSALGTAGQGLAIGMEPM